MKKKLNNLRSTKKETRDTMSQKKLTLNGINHNDEITSDVCQRTGDKGARSWEDTKLKLTPKAHDKFKRELEQLEKEFSGSDLIRKGTELILQGLQRDCGVDTGEENFRDTPNRVARLYMELFGANSSRDEEIEDILSKSFPSTYDDMVIVKDIGAKSCCPHHLLVVDYTICVAYLPKKGGSVLGLSKLSRLAQLVAARPALQEQTTHDIAELLYTRLKGCRGAAVYVEGKHSCVSVRGVKDSEATTVTSAVRGIYRNPRERARDEFFAAIGKPK